MENEGEMNLTIRAMVAQEESRKMSERIKAGQAISRKNGVLYGNGNLLGYDRVGDTYVINEEQAETVRMIFNMYETGYGLQMIRDELIKRERKNSSGLVKWDNTRILRCLHNSAYKGVVAYNKSHRNNYLEQKVIVNHDVLGYENLPRVAQAHPFSKEEIKKYLLEFISPNIIDFNENIIDKFVTQIKVESEIDFSWYLRFDLKKKLCYGK